MPTDLQFRDYSLTGPNAGRGFAANDWYTTPIPRKRLKELMRRSDRPALINYGLWLGLVFAFGTLLVAAWGTWWALPAAMVYGVLYGSGGDSRWHECGHGTVFRTRWLNEAFYHLTAFMALRNPYLWRWSHARHHTDTVVVGRDPEIAFPRPPSLRDWLLNLLYIRAILTELSKMLCLGAGRLTEDQKSFLPASEHAKTFLASRIQLGILIAVASISGALQSWLPLMLIGLPTFYGSWLHHVLATTQHAGLAEDIPDHRLNSRTVYLNPLFRFIYSNMNYHIEHHMYPMVPFYRLPDLHEEIRADCPPPYPSLWACYRELVPAILRQQTDPGHYIRRPLPDGAGQTPDHERPRFMAAE
ncbi:MAG: fatty acid desaturase [Rhodobacter sp.]|nr:fatty acid desaturase [Rhodobacter sp.]